RCPCRTKKLESGAAGLAGASGGSARKSRMRKLRSQRPALPGILWSRRSLTSRLSRSRSRLPWPRRRRLRIITSRRRLKNGAAPRMGERVAGAAEPERDAADEPLDIAQEPAAAANVVDEQELLAGEPAAAEAVADEGIGAEAAESTVSAVVPDQPFEAHFSPS